MRYSLQTQREPDALAAAAKVRSLVDELRRITERHQLERETAQKALKKSELYRRFVEQQAKRERQEI